jgi:hypothetical protein
MCWKIKKKEHFADEWLQATQLFESAASASSAIPALRGSACFYGSFSTNSPSVPTATNVKL